MKTVVAFICRLITSTPDPALELDEEPVSGWLQLFALTLDERRIAERLLQR